VTKGATVRRTGKEMGRKFIEEKLSTLACPTGTYGYYYLQVQAFPASGLVTIMPIIVPA